MHLEELIAVTVRNAVLELFLRSLRSGKKRDRVSVLNPRKGNGYIITTNTGSSVNIFISPATDIIFSFAPSS